MRKLKRFFLYFAFSGLIILLAGYYWLSVKWKENISEQELEKFAQAVKMSHALPERVYPLFEKVYLYGENTTTIDMIFKRIWSPNKVLGCGCMDANYPFERETLNRISLSLKLDKEVGPRKCIDFYLRQAYYSNNKRGFVQSSQFFFNKNIYELNDREIASLILMTKAPSRYDFRRNPEFVNNEINELLNQ